MPQMTAGEAVVASLQAQGVDTVFGIISVHTLDLFDALFDHQDDVRFIGRALGTGLRLHGRRLLPRHRQTRRTVHQHRPRRC